MDALARGETDMAHLIDRRSTDVKEHVTTEMSKVQKAVKAQAAELASDEQHKQLLHSLKYETMNERRNQIAESHEETFHWIFGCPVSPPMLSRQFGTNVCPFFPFYLA